MADQRLLSIIERFERLASEIADLRTDQKEIMSEAKSAGYDPKIIRALIKERAEDENKRAEREALLETYRAALGGIADLPLGVAAMEAA